jgi:DinB superfamily
MDRDHMLRDHVLYLLRGGGAHLSFDKAIAGLPAKLRGAKPAGLPYSPWRLLEHMRICQWDILDFCRNPHYKTLKFPDDYWPKEDAPLSATAWNASVKSFQNDLKEMEKLVDDPHADLFARIPHGDGQTILREALLVADHNSYHLGQLIVVRRMLGAWKEE